MHLQSNQLHVEFNGLFIFTMQTLQEVDVRDLSAENIITCGGQILPLSIQPKFNVSPAVGFKAPVISLFIFMSISRIS